MTVKQQVEAAIRDALKSGNQQRLSALRMIKAELLLKEKETGKDLDDAGADRALLSMLKKYRKARDEYESLGKSDEADRYERDMKIIESFLTAPMMDDSRIKQELERLVADLEATGPRDFGRVMKAFMSAHPNADGKVASSILKEILNRE